VTIAGLKKEGINLAEGVRQLGAALDEKKCLACGCLHGALRSIAETFSGEDIPSEFASCLESGRKKLQKTRYECLGCEVCYPAEALNALRIEGAVCTTAPVTERSGWPPLPGSYRVLRYRAPVAVCTLTDEDLSSSISSSASTDICLVGTVQTENLGIERVIYNIVANPNIRHLILCGADSKGSVGHLPGQSLISLARNGMGSDGRIAGAKGRRPLLKNISADAVEYFRKSVSVHDLIGVKEVEVILSTARACAQQQVEPVHPFRLARFSEIIQGRLPRKVTPDPQGYFVIYVDRAHKRLAMEHYHNDGTLNLIIEGNTVAELYTSAIERKLVGRLDHAAYLGRELSRAEDALTTCEAYVQDRAPEQNLSDPPGQPVTSRGCRCKSECQ